MSLYINPMLSNRDYGIVRVGGPGLANCMFFVARAAILAKKLNAKLMRPTWERIGIGQWIRKERDKRFYSGLFSKKERISGMRKAILLAISKKIKEEDAKPSMNGVVLVSGLRGYFSDLWENRDYVCAYFQEKILPAAIQLVPTELSNTVAVHVRLGDYPQKWRTDINWYVKVIQKVRVFWSLMTDADATQSLKFKVFSDGSNAELSELLAIPGVERADYGNAFADMMAISKCKLLIGSDSTFSGWGAFLGTVPCVFSHLHYGRPLEDENLVLITEKIENYSEWLQNVLNKTPQS